MSTEFIASDVWPTLTQAVKPSKQRCAVAVAYFGQGASGLLPLPSGSELVVDASEHAVASGQTCPADLIKLQKRGVRVFSVANLHAKVFVLGRAAFIGSANVSKRSASQLVEAVVRTTDAGAVRAAREFVRNQCVHELTPKVLKQLAELYTPPLLPGGKPAKKRSSRNGVRSELPRLMLVQLITTSWSDKEQTVHDASLKVAAKRQKHPRSYELDSFAWNGKCPYQRGDVVIQVTEEDRGRVLVTPPGNVLHVRHYTAGTRQKSFVYLEVPARRRRQLKVLARKLGRGAMKLLRRRGMVRDAVFAQALLRVLNN